VCSVLSRSNSIQQALTKSFRHPVLDTVANQLYYIPRTVQYGFAVGTFEEVRFHACTQFRTDIVVDIVRDFPPDLKAAYFHYSLKTRFAPDSFNNTMFLSRFFESFVDKF